MKQALQYLKIIKPKTFKAKLKVFVTYYKGSEYLNIYHTFHREGNYISVWSYKLKLHIKIPIDVWN